MTGPKPTAPLSADWMDRGACVGHEQPDLWHPKGRGSTKAERAMIAEAKAICGGCPVKAECLAEANAKGREGIWGGTTTDERAKPSLAVRFPGRPNPPTVSSQCGTYAGAGRHRRRREQFCGPCRDARNAYESKRKTDQRRAARQEAS